MRRRQRAAGSGRYAPKAISRRLGQFIATFDPALNGKLFCILGLLLFDSNAWDGPKRSISRERVKWDMA